MNAPKYQIAVICGSMRLFDDMLTVADELTRQGFLVFMPFVRKNHNQPVLTRTGSELEQQYGAAYARSAVHLDATPISGEALDVMHRAKIDLADLVVIVTNEAGYIGESTAAEIDYSTGKVKPIAYVRVDKVDYRDAITWLYRNSAGALTARTGSRSAITESAAS
ncbi:Uncharacterised protein [Mycobacteroides abscessus subsp. massiliense]|uniref:Nucleoside 2-deoxyribosyltransferase n=1 Tax=Mycobacteroides abscessus subsp. massiliense TaxID=1962118 RepID=A0A1T8VLZ3_9MYCO|nr:hypothetical protein [Mycobacteroides abscessus]SKN06083.1 Uncharacterised protein [Mycobacteroides abscessus subsp. massiliense]